MVFKLQHIINGFYPVTLGTFNDAQDAVEAIKDHVRTHSAITNPRYAKSTSILWINYSVIPVNEN